MDEKKPPEKQLKPERKPMQPETMTLLAMCGVFFVSLLMAAGVLQYILTILSVLCLAGYGVYLIKNRMGKHGD